MERLRLSSLRLRLRPGSFRSGLVVVAAAALGATAAYRQLNHESGSCEPGLVERQLLADTSIGVIDPPAAAKAGGICASDERVRTIGDWPAQPISAPADTGSLDVAPPARFSPDMTREPQPLATQPLTSLPAVPASEQSVPEVLSSETSIASAPGPDASPPAPDMTSRPAGVPGDSLRNDSHLTGSGPRITPRWPQSAQSRVIDEQARRHIAKGFSLGQRNALFAARKEFQQALWMIAETADASNGWTADHADSCVLALRRACDALEEAEDFSRCDGDRRQLTHMLEGHRTTLGHDCSFASAVAAQQAYLTFAGDELLHAAAGNRLAAQAFVGLGKCCLADEMQQEQALLRQGQALAYFLAAVRTDPRNHLAANEFGVLLGRFGQWSQAKKVMLSAVSLHGDGASWQNLATIHASLGEHELARLAAGESQRCRTAAGGNVYSDVDGRPTVQWVDPRAFGGPPDDAPVSAAQAQQARRGSALR